MTGASASSESEDQRPKGKGKGKSKAQWKKYWAREMAASEKRLREFIKSGNTINRIFLDDRKEGSLGDGYDALRGAGVSKLNLFFSNTTTLMDMLYGQQPTIDVKREFDDPDDDEARVASNILQRLLEADVSNEAEDETTVYRSCLQDRLLSGLAVGRVRYDMQETQVTTLNPDTGLAEDQPKLAYEAAPIDYVHWQDFRWGWARTWREVPWIGLRSWMDKDAAAKRFTQEVADQLTYKNQLPTGSEEADNDQDSEQRNSVQKAEIWEIWDKKSRKVFWWSEGADKILDIKDDPLKLDGFWPVPKPWMANTTTTLLMPRADYVLAQDLYQEIDVLQTRITIITEAVKVVGVYDQSAGDSVGRMMKEGAENDLIPVESWAMFAEKGGLAGVIDWFPIGEVVGVLKTLQEQLSARIGLLYQITGMSDIMRGADTDQYTSDGTNQLKAKFGSIRVQALQDEYALFCSNLEALKAEVIAKHFQPASIIKQSGARFLPKADHPLVEPALMLIKSPEIKWRVNIKPESIAMVDYAQLKQERTEFLTAIATFIQSAMGMAKEMPGSLPVMMEMLKWGMAGFKGSDYLEGIMDQAIEQAKNAPPQQNDDGKAQADKAKIKLEEVKNQGALQKIQAKQAADIATAKVKLQGEIQKITVDAARDQTIEQMQAQNRLTEIARELQATLTEIEASMHADVTIEETQAALDIASQQTEHQNNITEIRANAKVQAASQSRDREE